MFVTNLLTYKERIQLWTGHNSTVHSATAATKRFENHSPCA